MNAVWCVVIGFISLLLQLGGFVSPGWMRFGSGSHTLDMGLWYGCGYGECISYFSVDVPLVDRSAHARGLRSYLESQIEATIGVLAVILGLILTCTFYRKNPVDTKTARIIAIICFLVSGIASWIPAGRFAHQYSLMSQFIDVSVPYSVILTGLGASLALFDAIVLMVMMYKANQGQAGYVV
ncbi:hypothetical protein ScPMuIL_004187 [Solemya velum]